MMDLNTRRLKDLKLVELNATSKVGKYGKRRPYYVLLEVPGYIMSFF